MTGLGRAERRLRRRTFLKALGLGIATPLAWEVARRVHAAPGAAPTRLLIYYVPHGVPVEHFEPFGAGGGFLAESTILSPLAPYSDKVSVVRGISMNDGATNHAAIRATLTGFNEGTNIDSIDATIASALGVTPHVLGAIPYSAGAGFNVDSHLVKHGTWVVPQIDPAEAAADLLGGLGDPGPEPEIDETEFRRQTLQLTEAELEALQAEVSSLTKEETKLQLHLDAVRSLQAGGGSGVTPMGCDSAPVLPAVEALAGLDVLDQTNFGRVLDAHLEVAAHAFRCGTARVITLQNMWVNSGINFGFAGGPGVAKGHHDPISHSWDQAGRDEFAECQRWFYDRLATKFLDVLDEDDPSAPGTKIIDNTLVYVCSEVCDGAAHNSKAEETWGIPGAPRYTYLPAVLIGGAGGCHAGGQVVEAERMHIDMLATVAHMVGAPLTSIGPSSVSVIGELIA